MSPVVAAEAAYPERQAAALLTNASVLKVSLRRDSFFICMWFQVRVADTVRIPVRPGYDSTVGEISLTHEMFEPCK